MLKRPPVDTPQGQFRQVSNIFPTVNPIHLADRIGTVFQRLELPLWNRHSWFVQVAFSFF